MDGRNNQFNPQNTRNRQVSNTLSADLNHILQHGVSPEQFAENARQLETYGRINAAALQVHLQRQSQQAEQRRQDELRLIQMAQQLASGSQQQILRQLPPPAPPIPHSHHSSFPQQAIAPRNPPMQTLNTGQPYNKSTTNSVASQHWSHVRQPPAPNVQHQQHHPFVNGSAPFVNQNGYFSLQTYRMPQPTGESSVLAASNGPTSQLVQPPNAAPSFVQKVSQYTQQPGMARNGSQINTGFDGSSGAITNHDAQQILNQRYETWVRVYGVAKAASMATEQMQLWQQQRQTRPTVPMSTPPTITPSTTSISAQSLQGQFRIPEQGGPVAASLPLPQTQQWHYSVPVVSNAERQGVFQSYPAASSDHAPVLHPSTNDSTIKTETVDGQSGLNTTAARNSAGVQSHHLGTSTSNPTVTSANVGSTLSALPSSQSGSTQSILLGSEEKGTSLYTLQGLAASIKRSLNAERLAASVEPSTSDRQKRKRLNSVEVTDTRHEAELSRPDPAPRETYVQEPLPKADPQPVNFVTEPDDPSPTMLPVSEASIPQQKTVHVPNGFAVPISQHDPPRNFVPFSTLAGAVSMDTVTGSVPTNYNAASSEAMGVIEDSTISQPTPETVLHRHIDVPLVPVSHSPFDHLSFTHRTPSPQLAATITPVRDEDEADEKAKTTPSYHSTPLHDEAVDSQLQSNPSRSGNDLEMDIASGEDHVQVHFDITSSEYTPHSEARDNASTIQEPDVFVSRNGLLDSSIEETDHELMGNLGAESRPVSETRSPEPAQARILAKIPPTLAQSPGSAETSGPGSLPKLPRKTLRKQDFYVAVPPPSEWVLRAKDREVERKTLVNEKTRQRSNKEYTECELANRLCPRHCHWNGCQAVLNSMFSLKQHVRRHQLEVKPVGPAMTVSCQWKQCRMVCEQSSLLAHLNRHIEKEMACIYEDCEERFSRIKDLAEHEKSEHADDEPPPSAVPRTPDLKPPVVLPQIVPSYTTTTRLASKPSITAERHARLGPWTLGMIIGHPTTGLDGDGYDTTLRARRTTHKAYDIVASPTFPRIGDSGEMTPNTEFVGRSAEYDLLEEAVGSGHSFGDLDTVEVTREFYDGSNVRGGTPWSSVGDDETQMDVDRDSLDVEALL